jgi:hypothetical protein
MSGHVCTSPKNCYLHSRHTVVERWTIHLYYILTFIALRKKGEGDNTELTMIFLSVSLVAPCFEKDSPSANQPSQSWACLVILFCSPSSLTIFHITSLNMILSFVACILSFSLMAKYLLGFKNRAAPYIFCSIWFSHLFS